MSNFKTTNLGTIGKVSMCKRILKNQTSESGDIPFYKISTFGGVADSYISRDIYEEYKNKYSFPKKGDVLISAAGTIGKTVIYDGEDAFYQDSNIVWIDNDEKIVSNEYLYYYYQLKPWRKTSGSTIERLYNDNIRSLKISYPEDKKIQQQITIIPKTIDELISKNNKVINDLETMSKMIYDYMFLQYKGIGLKEEELVYSDSFKRKIPSSWEIKKMSDVCTFKNGINYDKKTKGDKLYKIINVRNITASSFILNEEDLDEIVLESKSADNYIVGRDDILIARSGTPGAVRLIFSDNELIFSGFIISCTPLNNKYKYFISYYIKQYEGTGATKTGGSILQNVSQDTLKSIMICLPPEELIDKYNDLVEPIMKNIKQKTDENNKLAKLKEELLPLLFNGQIDTSKI